MSKKTVYRVLLHVIRNSRARPQLESRSFPKTHVKMPQLPPELIERVLERVNSSIRRAFEAAAADDESRDFFDTRSRACFRY